MENTTLKGLNVKTGKERNSIYTKLNLPVIAPENQP